MLNGIKGAPPVGTSFFFAWQKYLLLFSDKLCYVQEKRFEKVGYR